MPLTIATWNVNSVRARLDNVISWLKSADADIVCLQEIKAQEETFPYEAIEAAGYQAQIVGQKSYNGVAILSKEAIKVHHRTLPGNADDPQARYIECSYKGVRIACLYLPNGNPMDSAKDGTAKYDYKIAWMQRLRARMAELLTTEEPLVFCGDYNIIPEPEDCYDPSAWTGDALFALKSRQEFQAMLNLGLYDAFRVETKGPSHYSYWDYTGGAYNKDNGIRIDHHLLSAQALDRLEKCWIDRAPRALEKASDHTPVLITLAD